MNVFMYEIHFFLRTYFCQNLRFIFINFLSYFYLISYHGAFFLPCFAWFVRGKTQNQNQNQKPEPEAGASPLNLDFGAYPICIPISN